MNQPVRRGLKVFSPQGLITLSLVMVVAFLFADAEIQIHSRHHVRLSWLGVQALSFPLGWLAYWLAKITSNVIPAGHDSLKFLFVYTISAAGTVLNIHLIVSAIFWYFRNRNVQRQPEEREAEFQKLLAEHRKRSS